MASAFVFYKTKRSSFVVSLCCVRVSLIPVCYDDLALLISWEISVLITGIYACLSHIPSTSWFDRFMTLHSMVKGPLNAEIVYCHSFKLFPKILTNLA